MIEKVRLVKPTEKRVSELKEGEHIEFGGYEWVVLDTQACGGVLVIMANIWKTMKFGDNNNYEESGIRDELEKLAKELGEDNLVPHIVDLIADNGDKAYGTVLDKVFLISCDEYRKYRDHIPLYDGWIWTCTPWVCKSPYASNASYVRYVNPDGHVYSGSAGSATGVAPACILIK